MLSKARWVMARLASNNFVETDNQRFITDLAGDHRGGAISYRSNGGGANMVSIPVCVSSCVFMFFHQLVTLPLS
jgi:hypothetical protein